MTTVHLFRLGYVANVDLRTVARFINKLSPFYTAQVGKPVESIGQRDLFNTGYSFEKLFSLFPAAQANTIRVGIIARPIEDNLFSESRDDRILISVFEADEFCAQSGRSMEEYLIFVLLAELLWLKYWQQKPGASYRSLFHEETRACLFDFCEYKDEIVDGLREYRIEEGCKERLMKANIPSELVNSTERLLAALKRPSFTKSLNKALEQPVFSLLLGGGIVGLITNITSSILWTLTTGPNGDPSIYSYFVIAVLAFLVLLLILGYHVIAGRNVASNMK